MRAGYGGARVIPDLVHLVNGWPDQPTWEALRSYLRHGGELDNDVEAAFLATDLRRKIERLTAGPRGRQLALRIVEWAIREVVIPRTRRATEAHEPVPDALQETKFWLQANHWLDSGSQLTPAEVLRMVKAAIEIGRQTAKRLRHYHLVQELTSDLLELRTARLLRESREMSVLADDFARTFRARRSDGGDDVCSA